MNAVRRWTTVKHELAIETIARERWEQKTAAIKGFVFDNNPLLAGNKQRNVVRNGELCWDDLEQEVGGKGEAGVIRLKG